MDELSQLIEREIKRNYKSVRHFSQVMGLPNSTIVSILKNGAGGASFNTITKICKTLNINTDNRQPLIIDNESQNILEKYHDLDHMGKHTVNTVLDMEYNRIQKEKPHIAAFGGNTPAKTVDEDILEVHRILRNTKD